MQVLKFGGKSLSNGLGINQVVSIIAKKYYGNEQIVVVVSARGNATNELIEILEQAKKGNDYKKLWNLFKEYQSLGSSFSFKKEWTTLEKLFEEVRLLADYTDKTKDVVVSFGEVLSAKYLTDLLIRKEIQAEFVDARQLITTDDNFGNAKPIESITRAKVLGCFAKNKESVKIVTGYIGSTQKGETTTLGRNGSNFTASLLANCLEAKELQNYTHVDGIYTADPNLVADARKIKSLSFLEANELANLGATILHAKTIIPLAEKNIPLRILNTFNPDSEGTLITAEQTSEGIKSLTVLNEVALVNFEGRRLLGKKGIDARIFKVLADNQISVSVVSQEASERGIGFIINADRAQEALVHLKKEFENDLYLKDVNSISVREDVAVISIIGQDLSTFHKSYSSLIKNKIISILFNKTTTGKNVSLVVEKENFKRALNVIHEEIFGTLKKINIVIFGHGTVGGTLIQQILDSKENIQNRKEIKLNIFAIVNSKKTIINKKGIGYNWKELFQTKALNYSVKEIIAFAHENYLENLIMVDNTANKDFVQNYQTFIENGFDVVSSNKVANTLRYDSYKKLRKALDKNQKSYLYETNVGAGLPLIDTIKLLHLSGENITKIKSVFSGSLSSIFNHFSVEEKPFSEVLKEAIAKGYTEPDPREDLCGNDVARKLLILARELDLQNEFDEIHIQNLIPEPLREIPTEEFLQSLEQLDGYYNEVKRNQTIGNVLRYVGELSRDLQQDKGNLEVKLVSVSESSALGQLKGSDSIFEIYTESYGERSIVIQGAGAGASVTARGVFGDILRIADKN
ncbi:bifunctional aspartate kinase/homoserine dehydrogenase I [Flavobacterium columnare]|uniref:bifunctional aspartate kinase/homoserine dehydrogenase I n=1 Tax=Flavobacterium columnare TaxID=996 RepID=UPI000D1AF4AB|nr:bifunctional aspartate kinase/homoserine dehydrogenase I [Flavobacterium columnare]PTD14549.1 bifunctional aspartate kinase/homoserine dehydrogenase I [Flavobacterium columnare]